MSCCGRENNRAYRLRVRRTSDDADSGRATFSLPGSLICVSTAAFLRLRRFRPSLCESFPTHPHTGYTKLHFPSPFQRCRDLFWSLGRPRHRIAICSQECMNACCGYDNTTPNTAGKQFFVSDKVFNGAERQRQHHCGLRHRIGHFFQASVPSAAVLHVFLFRRVYFFVMRSRSKPASFSPNFFNVTCTLCSHSIPQSEQLRVDSERIRCPSCGGNFIPASKGKTVQAAVPISAASLIRIAKTAYRAERFAGSTAKSLFN